MGDGDHGPRFENAFRRRPIFWIKRLAVAAINGHVDEDSDADLARDLRRLVREQVAAGASDAQVMRFVHDRYGDFVLLRPPFKATTALLWATPALALGGGVLLILGMRRRRAAAAGAEPAVLTEAERIRLARLEGRGGAG